MPSALLGASVAFTCTMLSLWYSLMVMVRCVICGAVLRVVLSIKLWIVIITYQTFCKYATAKYGKGNGAVKWCSCGGDQCVVDYHKSNACKECRAWFHKLRCLKGYAILKSISGIGILTTFAGVLFTCLNYFSLRLVFLV